MSNPGYPHDFLRTARPRSESFARGSHDGNTIVNGKCFPETSSKQQTTSNHDMTSIRPYHRLPKPERYSNNPPSQFQATDNHFGNKILTQQYGNPAQHIEMSGVSTPHYKALLGSRFIQQNGVSAPPEENGFLQTQPLATPTVTQIESSAKDDPLHFFVKTCFSPKFKLTNESPPIVQHQENQPQENEIPSLWDQNDTLVIRTTLDYPQVCLNLGASC